MPCYTISTAQIELGPKTDAQLLRAALAALDLNPRSYSTTASAMIQFNGGTYDPLTGRLTLRTGTDQGNTDTERNIKRAYMAQQSAAQARKYGWTIQAVAGNPYKFTATKA